MDKKYYISLVCAFIFCTIPPCVIYYSSFNIDEDKEQIKTTYLFENVAGPIQPIPRQLIIDKDWVLLGKALFNSPLLSKDNTTACASCHMINFGGDDGFPVSTGINNAQGERNSPTVLNATFNFRQFWDGRASTLAEQMVGPIHNPVEMGSSFDEIIEKLSQDEYFKSSFSRLSDEGITTKNIIKAITTYEESLITPNSPIDRYLLGDKDALTAQQVRGLSLFTDYGCATCHQGRNIGGNIYQKLGRVSDIPNILTLDKGKFLLTNEAIDEYIFKVPTLRNIAETAPYFHNGSIQSLPEAVRIMAASQLGRDLTDNEVEDIVAVLQAFSAELLEVK
jgi:cytochrome c peroxidase